MKPDCKFVAAALLFVVFFINTGLAEGSRTHATTQLILKEDLPFIEHNAVRMGTDVSILIQSEQREAAESAIRAALAEIERIENIMTDWREPSEVMAINNAAGKKPVRVGKELLFLLQESKRLAKLTSGAFDITYAAVGKLWNFTNRSATPPSAKAVTATRKLVDYRQLVIDSKQQTAFLAKRGMRIGLGGIAKGYAVDRAVEVIKRAGFKNFAVNAGGDLTVRGRKAGKLWWVAIRHPRDKTRNIAILPISNGSVVTSGDSERYFEYQGKRYGHILDPRTGYPAARCQSVTIMAKQAYMGDGVATGVFVLGSDAGMRLIESLPDIEGLIVAADGRARISSGLQQTP